MNKLVILLVCVLFFCVVLSNAKYTAKSAEELDMMKRIIIEKLKKEQKAREEAAKLNRHKVKRELTGNCPLDPDDPAFERITMCSQIANMDPNGCYKIITSLTCNSLSSYSQVFQGTLHGKGNTISGLTSPLFDEVGANGCVEDVMLSQPNIVDAGVYVGAIARNLTNARVSRIVIDGASSLVQGTGASGIVGGIASAAENSNVHDCLVESDVTVKASGTPSAAAGIVCVVGSGSVLNITEVKGTVEGVTFAGGIACTNDGLIQDFLFTGTVTMTNKKRFLGGLTGTAGVAGSNTGTVQNGVSNTLPLVGGGAGTTNVLCLGVSDPAQCTATINSLDGSVAATLGPHWVDANGNLQLISTSGVGGVLNDPHFFPLWKHNPKNIRYTVYSGIKGAVYNIVTDAMVQWNAKFNKYDNLPYNFQYPEYVVAAGLTLGHPNNLQDVRIEVSPETYPNSKFYDGTLSVKVNGVPLQKGEKFYFFGSQYPDFYVIKYTSRHVAISSDLFYLKYHLQFISDNFLHDPAKMKRELDGRPTARWPFFNSRILTFDGMEGAHGILGQTARDTSPYKPAYTDCFECFVEGKLSDYRIEGDDLFGTNFKYNLFTP